MATYEDSDKDLVFAQAAQVCRILAKIISRRCWEIRGFLKVDFALNAKKLSFGALEHVPLLGH